MSTFQIGLLMFGGMLALMALRAPIAISMFVPGALGYLALSGWGPLLAHLKGAVYGRVSVYDLSVIPLFMLMGAFAVHGGLSKALFDFANALLGRFRGGMAMADVVWTLPGYTAGRFPSVEAFELPFMMQSPEATSKALWDYVALHASQEFKDVKPLAFHVHGDGVFHMTSKPVRTMADLRGLKLRAPTRQTNKFIAMLGATPVSMPVPQVGDALSKGVIDGAVVPYEVVPSVKIQELVKYHSETDPAQPAFYTSTFVFAMNKAKYESLPPDLKKVIDANSGQGLSGQIGKAFLQADLEGKKLTVKNTTNTIPASELATWKQLGDRLAADWVKEMDAKGLPGAKMLADAKALIAKHAGSH